MSCGLRALLTIAARRMKQVTPSAIANLLENFTKRWCPNSSSGLKHKETAQFLEMRASFFLEMTHPRTGDDDNDVLKMNLIINSTDERERERHSHTFEVILSH